MSLLHAHQGEGFTCLYHATYAVTGDEAWLDWARLAPGTCSTDLRHQQRLVERGLLLYPLHSVQRSVSPPVDEAFWGWLQHRFVQDGAWTPVPLLVTAWGRHLYHTVAVLFPCRPTEPVLISDSRLNDLLTLSWPDFLASSYAAAYRVEMLVPVGLAIPSP